MSALVAGRSERLYNKTQKNLFIHYLKGGSWAAFLHFVKSSERRCLSLRKISEMALTHTTLLLSVKGKSHSKELFCTKLSIFTCLSLLLWLSHIVHRTFRWNDFSDGQARILVSTCFFLHLNSYITAFMESSINGSTFNRQIDAVTLRCFSIKFPSHFYGL